MSLLDPRFKYVPAASTDVAGTWRRFGFKPVTDEERRARLLRGRPPEEAVRIFPSKRSGASTAGLDGTLSPGILLDRHSLEQAARLPHDE